MFVDIQNNQSSQACLASVVASFSLPTSGATAKPDCPVLVSSLLPPGISEKPISFLLPDPDVPQKVVQPLLPPGISEKPISFLPPGPDVPQKSMQRLRRRRANTVRIATHLQTLEQYDSRRVVVVKRIARLGPGNDEVLRKHFEVYGPVCDVFLANPPLGTLGHDGSGNHEDMRTRFRPSGMAHVLMDNAADAERIFAEGDSIPVGGVAVLISRFWRRASPLDDEGCSKGEADGVAISL